MALWQFECLIIPKACSPEFNNLDIKSWLGITINDETIQYLQKILVPQKSWSKDILQFGHDDETCIKIIKENNNFDEIICKLDLRTLKRIDIEKILNFIEKINGELFYLNNVYPSTLDSLLTLINKSDAYKFCQNPIKYFENLNLNDPDEI